MRANLNLNGLEIFKEHRYLNCVKAASRGVTAGDATWWQKIDADYYPTSGNTISRTVYLHKAGNYCVRWLGVGSVTLPSFGTLTGSGGTFGGTTYNAASSGASQTNGRMTFTVATQGKSSTLTTTASGGMSNLVIAYIGTGGADSDETKLDNGQIFRDEFLTLIRNYNPSSLRMMDIQSTNDSLLVEWADRPRVTACSYVDRQFKRTNIPGDNGSGVGVSTFVDTGTVNQYSLASYSGMPGTYQHGEIVHFMPDTSNTRTACTLNVGARGAKTLVMEAGTNPTTSGSFTDHVTINSIYTAIYDAKVDKWFLNTGYGAQSGHPLEILVALCNVSGLPGWFSIPAYASDDFITQFANYLAANYTPSAVLIEYVNEIWNAGVGGFPMTNRLAVWGDVTFSGIGGGNGANYSGWYGYRFRQIAQIMRPILGSKLKMVMAGKGGWGDTDVSTLQSFINLRLQNNSYPELSGSNSPSLFKDYISYGLYYAGKSFQSTDAHWTNVAANMPALKTILDNYFPSGVKTTDQSVIRTCFEWARDDMLASGGSYPVALTRFDNWNTVAAANGVPVIIYEQNHEVQEPSTSWAASNATFSNSAYGGTNGYIGQFWRDFIASPQYGQVVSSYVNAFAARSKSEATSLYGMTTGAPWLSFSQISSTDGLGGDTTQSSYSNYQILQLINNGKRRLLIS